MESSSTAHFAHAARTLGREARRRGLVGPSFRCPPRLVGVDRTLRRRPGGGVVSVRLRGRPWPAVLADMIEGVVAVNDLAPPRGDPGAHRAVGAVVAAPTDDGPVEVRVA